MLLVVVAVGCTASEPSTDTFSNTPIPNAFSQVHYAVIDAMGNRQIVSGVSELGDVTPFDIIFPHALPKYAELESVVVILPPDNVDDAVKYLHVTVSMIYRNEDEGFMFHLEERIDRPNRINHPDLSTVNVDLAGGTQIELDIFEEISTRQSHVRAAWEGCGIGFSLNASSTEEEFSNTQLPDIVREMMESCI